MATSAAYIDFDEGAAPATPAAGKVRVYAKTDGSTYQKDDAGTETGLAGGGSSGAIVLLDTQTVTGSDGTITFSSIPNTYNDLVIVGRVRDDDASEIVNDGLTMRVGNGTVDSGTNYDYLATVLRGDGMTPLDSDAASANLAVLGARVTANSAAAGRFTPVHIEIIDYADASVRRSILAHAAALHTTSTASRVGPAAAEWKNAADEIDIVTIAGASFGNLKVGSKLRLYGRL